MRNFFVFQNFTKNFGILTSVSQCFFRVFFLNFFTTDNNYSKLRRNVSKGRSRELEVFPKFHKNFSTILPIDFKMCGNVSSKFGRNCKQNLKKWGKYSVQNLKNFDGNFVTFFCQSLKKFVKNYRENMKLFRETFRKIRKNFKKMQTLGEFWKTNFALLAKNFGEMLEILRKFWKFFRIIS